ncbi:MAG TPA: phage tail tip lysozyme [Candidatus Saccharimonadales bacterium]|nr:phage tail tip lysozyme [Candidatus Saccharimonadales bacterium]
MNRLATLPAKPAKRRNHWQRISFVLTSLVTILFGSGGVYAATGGSDCPKNMSALDCSSLIGNWVDWVPDNGSGSCGDLGTSTLQGNSNEQKAFNFFISQGLSPIAAAGIVGNLKEESQVDPTSVQGGKDSATIPPSIYDSGGYGIAQWTSYGRQKNLIEYAQKNGVQLGDPSGVPGNLTVQLEFLWQEANNSYSTVLQHVKAAATPGDAATQWMGPNITGADRSGGFENPLASAAHEDVRRKNAEDIYKANIGSTPTAAAAATDTTGSSCAAADVSTDGFIEYKQCVYRQFSKAVQQESAQWAGKPYGHSTVCAAGCGPSSMAMIITNLTGQRITPDVTAAYGAAHGTQEALPDSGSLWNIADVVGSHWGLKSKELGRSVTNINTVLQAGGLVLATGRDAPDPFTVGGHFIVIRALTSNGEWMTGNSAGFDSSKPYTTDHVMAYLRDAWGLTKQ